MKKALSLSFIVFLVSTAVGYSQPFLAYISNGGSAILVIDTSTNTVIDTVNSEFNVSFFGFIAVSPDASRVYFSSGLDRVSVIDTSTNAVIEAIEVGVLPSGIAVSPDGMRVYAAGADLDFNGIISVIDASTNAVIDTIDVGILPRGVAVAPDGLRVYVANQGEPDEPPPAGTVSVIDASTNAVIDTIDGGIGPSGIAVTPDGLRVYVTNINDDTVSVINTSDNTVIDTINVGDLPHTIAVTPDGERVYVANSDNSVSVIDTSSNQVIDTLNVGDMPLGVGVTPDGSRVYVVNSFSATVSVIDTSTNTVVDTINNVGFQPQAFGIFIGPSIGGDGEDSITADGITLTTDIGEFDSASIVSVPDSCPSVVNGSNVEYPFGFITFAVNVPVVGSTINVTIDLPPGANPDAFFKANAECSEYPGVVSIGGGVIVASYTDGGQGDLDGEANGVIVDPGGPALFTGSGGRGNGGCSIAQTAQSSSTMLNLIILIIPIFVVGYRVVRRGNKNEIGHMN